MLLDRFKKYADFGPLFLRFSVGIIFIVHGIGKLLGVGPAAMGMTGTTGFITSLGFPEPVLFAWLLAIVETFGGLFLLIGFLTRISALLLAIDMLIAFLLVHLKNGFLISNGGFEFVFVLFFASLALLVRGPGKYLKIDKN